MWGWHNRGCVWNKVASECAGEEQWSSKREQCQTIEDKRAFITFALQSVKHSAVHRTRIGKKKKGTVDCKESRILGPSDKSIHTREEGPTVHLFGDSNVAEKMYHWSLLSGTKLHR